MSSLVGSRSAPAAVWGLGEGFCNFILERQLPPLWVCLFIPAASSLEIYPSEFANRKVTSDAMRKERGCVLSEWFNHHFLLAFGDFLFNQ